MKRVLELGLLASTALALVATSRAPVTCAPDALPLQSSRGCGAAGVVLVTTAADCTLQVDGATDAGLPATGLARGQVPDAGALQGFSLFGTVGDGGIPLACSAVPPDGGLALACEPACGEDAGACEGACTGQFVPVP
ncbi:MAG: hypothetical protein FJ086_00765 [Deltaproteobacteria bacterium]|nr:hypothetical protein [Deltaproteobacteria bacterium]